jgi:hypothetical protein
MVKGGEEYWESGKAVSDRLIKVESGSPGWAITTWLTSTYNNPTTYFNPLAIMFNKYRSFVQKGEDKNCRLNAEVIHEVVIIIP